jgi:hypothetical protein
MALRKFLHLFELRIAVTAALLLLVAQLGAMSHAYSHDAAVGSPPTHESGASSHNPCNDCLAYAPLLAVAGAASVLPFVEPQRHGAAARHHGESVADLSLSLAFRSRAPPDSR